MEGKLAAIAAAGYDAVEIFENDLIASPHAPRAVRQMMADLGLECVLFQPFRDFEGMPGDLRQQAFDRFERKFDVMQELGTDLVLVCSNVSPQSLGDRQRIVDDFYELGERAAARGLRIGYEALAWGRHIFDHRDAWSVVKSVNHPSVGLILDSFHSLARNVPIDSIAAIDPEKLFIVQVADAPRMEMDYLYWSRHFRCMPGQGDLPIADYVAALIAIGYDGPLSLEIFNDRFRAGSASGIAADGYRSLRYAEDEARRRLSVAPSLPARAPVDGVAFIEFAASEGDGLALGAMLRTLGFRCTGRHLRKAVTRWQQGDINLVLNCENEGFAHSHEVVHGPAVCAIGLRVPDVPVVLARADALRIPRFVQAVAPDEFEIPSVRGVGGSLIYFVDPAQEAEIWSREFTPAEAAGDADGGADADAAGAGLIRFDHLAQAMGFEEFLSWLLYYCALFDVQKTPQLEIADPLGIVHSQAVESSGGGLRITLNGSAAAQTLSSRFLQNYMGAGVQHIALSCDDIFAASDRLAALGMERLEIPANYYDDLASRFGLDHTLVERLRASSILYDRSGDAEYFQLYSRAFARRFFFEIVERRDYSGYGATNATVRLAAQSRYRIDIPA
ncbi:sugar phosphate isomerase/epimerase and 4-hydroxyphenylpyruvate domain-containing protein [Sphingomonas sp. BGYR3]|uniref:bifunctional sugar phosphate isomerase/epimerase/4-hydroxyphenylpyruvate dioxygenase family protein n=1 Tax=Sphingomonas sp. BGYR3 TaxID=2975483 RepID=UPI0024357122|nr:sugar phosphate isomerase/epimerase and 4-hydroxyphenylpyruvate domain-containing protein [Sphingomonas sp. BGYR3]